MANRQSGPRRRPAPARVIAKVRRAKARYGTRLPSPSKGEGKGEGARRKP